MASEVVHMVAFADGPGGAQTPPAPHLADLARADGTHRVVVAQGRAMGRPSRIEAEAVRAHGTITATRVGGSAVRGRG